MCFLLRLLSVFPSILPSIFFSSRPSCLSTCPIHLCIRWWILLIRLLSTWIVLWLSASSFNSFLQIHISNSSIFFDDFASWSKSQLHTMRRSTRWLSQFSFWVPFLFWCHESVLYLPWLLMSWLQYASLVITLLSGVQWINMLVTVFRFALTFY